MKPKKSGFTQDEWRAIGARHILAWHSGFGQRRWAIKTALGILHGSIPYMTDPCRNREADRAR